MKKKLAVLATGIILLCASRGNTQNLIDEALLFSRTKTGGSARIQSMGGAQTSLGGDYSSAFSNPAGLGMFNRSEFSISPGVNFSNTNSKYLGNATTDSRSNFFVPGLSAVFHRDANRGDGSFLGGSFAFTFNHVNNFNSSFNYDGVNANNSIVDYIIDDASGHTSSELNIPKGIYSNTLAGLAYSTFLIDTIPNTTTSYVSPVASPFVPRSDVRQREFIQNKGSQKQWSLSYGANFSDKIFLGAGVGLTSISYEQNKAYTESDYHFSGSPSFNPIPSGMRINENLTLNGFGINATLGVIGRPVDFVQVGVSYTTPTIYQITDTYQATMDVGWRNNFDYYGNGTLVINSSDGYEYTNPVQSQYSLRTPGKLNFGATAFIQKRGLVTADVEMVNYSKSRYSSVTPGLSYSEENGDIKTVYKPAVNYRAGGEYRLKSFRLRAGYSYMTDPYRSVQNETSNAISSVTGGVGYKGNKFYIDLAAIFSSGNTSYRPYTVNSGASPVVSTQNKNTTVMATLGFPF